MKNKNVIGICPMALVIAALLIFMSTGVAMATVWTGQLDYAPGSIVIISGNNSDGIGYLAGETVNVSVNGPYQYDSKCSTIADANGAWSCQITLSSDYTAEGNYTYTAVGQTYGVTQSGAFTDGFATFTIKFNANGLPSGTAVDVVVSYTQPNGNLQTGQTKSFVTPNAGGNTGTKPGTQFTYTYPGSIPVSGTTYYLISTSQASPFTTGADGNSLTVIATYSPDTTPPVVTVPADIIKEAAGPTGAIVSYTVTATDNVGVTSGPTCSPASGSTFALGDTTVTCTAKDAAGNTGSASFKISVKDTTPPTITAPADKIGVEATGTLTTVALGSAIATDLVDPSPVVTNNAPASFPLGTTDVIWTSTDASGYKATATQKVTVVDTTPPTIASHGDETAEATSASGAVVTYTSPATIDAVDGAGVATCVPASGTTFVLGDSTVKCDVTDAHGNKATQTNFAVHIVDTTPPVIASHGDENAEATGPSGALVSYISPATTDAIDGAGVANCLPISGSTFVLGDNIIKCDAKDAAGNSAIQTTFKVSVEDTTPPKITVPTDVVKEATGPKTTVDLGTASATDLVDGVVTVTNDAPADFPVGDTTVTYTTTDAHSNKATATQKVTITDTTPPTVVVPDDITAEATGPTGAVVTFTVSASDLVDGSVMATCTPTSGSMFALETTTVICSATDVHSNAATKSFKVTVQDTIPPTINTHTDITIEATSSSGAVVDYVSPTTYDIVDGSGTAGCTPISGSTFTLGDTTVTCSATDAHGNKATDINFAVHVVDTTPPTIDPHTDIITEATGPTGATVGYISPVTHDVVDGDGVASCVPTSGSTFTLGDTTVKCDATDVHGNKAIQTTFKVTVQDTTPPTVTVPADIITEATGPTGAVVTFAVTATDIVDGSVIPTCTPISGATFPLGNTLVICSATDTHSNTGSGSFSIKVQDTTPPVITVNGDNPATVMLGSSYTDAGATANDIVDGSFPATATGTVDTTTVGTYTITYSVTDKAGNTAAIQTRTVKVIYQSGGTCYGNAGHQILQPINPDSSSVFKYGSTVPAKFRVCNAGGNSVGTPGVVANFKLLSTTYGAGSIDENVVSTTPDTAFRWDPTAQQWIFNMNTKNLKSSYKYTYRISLNDGSNIDFVFGLK